ncbi:type II toxin-antitoxin system HicA family toxin [Chelatococcus sp.]|uniref:type II toxin-antitoxin system HicA family toxin n=1 Tax=Chelatococcus sp. TaxID=1953771 RepID=UPI001EB618C8|nr:type II toxin-antitoxin system HicA family toxin [Chelatococcus sp.]MBX3543595.1 type II toxin-antitoxin system HicA family toxin [Chelatococcus sp.]
MSNVETNRAKIIRKLEREGWVLDRHGAQHDIYAHPSRPGIISVPRHRTLSPGVGRNIANIAGWR